jgi:hypothetical protein
MKSTQKAAPCIWIGNLTAGLPLREYSARIPQGWAKVKTAV